MIRKCGPCQLCCRLLPTREIAKPANTRCPHQRFGKGCAIYARRPLPCELWSCRWLVEDDTADMLRPDRAGYVIDMMPDYITVEDNDTDERTAVPVVQVWVDPRDPTAHRDPQLRAYLERRAAEGMAALIRYNSKRAMVLLAPPLNTTGDWIEHESGQQDGEHSVAQIVAALSGNLGDEQDDPRRVGAGTAVPRLA